MRGLRAFLFVVSVGLLVSADTKPGAASVTWRLLRALDLASGETSAELKKIDGTTVRIAGYMVPIETDEQEDASEFLIVPIAGGCIHTPPPPPNQIVYCRMMNNKKARIAMYEPNWFEGKILITKTSSPYGAVSYQMSVANVEPYKAK